MGYGMGYEMKSSSPNNGLKSVGEISFEATPLKLGGILGEVKLIEWVQGCVW